MLSKILFILLFVGTLFAQEPRFTDFYNNKDAAVSITFDDASLGQYKYAFPILKKYNLFATFGVVGDWLCDTSKSFSEDGYTFYKRMSKSNILALWARGNEIAWHGMKHKPYSSKLDWNRLNKQMTKELNFVNSYFSPADITTIFYPYSKTQGKVQLATKSSGFLFGRSGTEKYNDISDLDYYVLNSFATYNDSLPNTKGFNKIINDAKGKWCILMYHHIIPDTAAIRKEYKRHNIKDNYAVTPEVFDNQMHIISQKNYWVATLKEIGMYMMQKEHSEIIIDDTFITIECDLDATIYNHEMTVLYNGKVYNLKPFIKNKL